MGSVPTNIQLPATAPTSDPAVAGYLAQLGVQLNQWILQAATAINNSMNTVTIGNWTITQTSTFDLLLTYTGIPNGQWTIPNPAGQDLIVMAVQTP